MFVNRSLTPMSALLLSSTFSMVLEPVFMPVRLLAEVATSQMFALPPAPVERRT